ncbi:hypothetical protein JKP88DRAFT_284561 [Tribonema minus]|uniref:Uncharacterized protein n=1 Tax=Tribonema minus TaxID=303371 RepID=A0A835ZJ41_9STRA|nr:hypothetical protein JKP88DRAFT_284561 [Tribonema minus]
MSVARRKWFMAHAAYPRKRSRMPSILHPVLDAFLSLDATAYSLDHGVTPSERIAIKSARAFAVVAPDNPVLSWEDGIDGRQWALADMRKAISAAGDGVDVTEEVVAEWEREGVAVLCRCMAERCLWEAGEDVPDGSSIYLLVEYDGHAVLKQGGHESFMCVYGPSEKGWVFPPVPSDEACAAGLGTRRVDIATVDGADVTDIVRQLCGPRRDFWASTGHALTAVSVALAFKIHGIEFGAVTIGDVINDDIVW